jgi:general secretion pathway protein N
MKLPALPRMPSLSGLPLLTRLPRLRRGVRLGSPSRRRRAPRPSTVFADSTLASAAWARKRRAAWVWAASGACVGLVVGMVLFAPAAWLGTALASATNARAQLVDARGSVWSGSAVLMLTGGADSRDASALPGRLQWSWGWSGLKPEVRLQHPCCLAAPVVVQPRAGVGTWSLTLLPTPAGLGTWPAAWLAGLGTPFNTLQLSGNVRIASPGTTLEWVQGRMRMQGSVQLDFIDVGSRIVAIDTLGSYQLVVSGGAANADAPVMSLATLRGPLQLSGSGQWTGARLRFTGEASASEGSEAVLNNLLNVIGRRNGARSVISIG